MKMRSWETVYAPLCCSLTRLVVINEDCQRRRQICMSVLKLWWDCGEGTNKDKQAEGEQGDERRVTCCLRWDQKLSMYVCHGKGDIQRLKLILIERGVLCKGNLEWTGGYGCMNLSGVVSVVGVSAHNDTTVGVNGGDRTERCVRRNSSDQLCPQSL